MNIYHVLMTAKALKQIEKLPRHIVLKLEAWVEAVGHEGIIKVRRIPGYHDEPLKGKRKGQRSIRLNKSYRAIYSIEKDMVAFIEVQEVSNHEY